MYMYMDTSVHVARNHVRYFIHVRIYCVGVVKGCGHYLVVFFGINLFGVKLM